MFDEKDVSEENRKKLWGHYNNKLSKGIDVGFGSSVEFDDSEIVKSLKNDVARFSAFKETSFKNDLEKLMVKNERLVPWSEFKKEAYKLSGDYNGTWLETEYHHTIASSNMAQKWKEFERDVDLYPNLKIVTVNDNRRRNEHGLLDGVIRSFYDVFWDTHMMPLDWGCRCDIEQTDEDVTEVPGGFQTKIEFENNSGKTGKIFGGTAYETNLSEKEKKEAQKNADRWSNELRENAELQKLKKPKYKKVGDVLVSEYADKSGLVRDTEVAQKIFDMHKAIVKIRPTLNPMIVKGTKNPEYEINGKISDRKSPTKGNFTSLLKKAKDQDCENIVFDLERYPYEIGDFLRKLRSNFVNNDSYPLIRDFYIVKDNKVLFITRKELKKATY